MDSVELIGKYRNRVLNAAIIVAALVISANIYKGQLKTLAGLTEMKANEEKKSALLDKISGMEQEINAYKTLIYKKETSAVINTIGNIARENSVTLVSIQSMTLMPFKSYAKYPFKMDIEVNSYHTLGRFISQLENHPDIYAVESITIRNTSYAQEESGNVRLSADLTISAILFRD